MRGSGGFSFAQVREAYILAGQFAYDRGAQEIAEADLVEGVERVRGEAQAVAVRLNGPPVGFESVSR